MKQWLILDCKDLLPIAKHWVNIPDVTEPGFYRAILSIDSLRNREADRHYKSFTKQKSLGRHLDVISPRDITYRKQFDVFLLEADLPTFYHNSIWDAYHAIGYDYKKRRFRRFQAL